ncbi:MAG: DUF3108 domain-containing protein [Candidatus Marinimicrobia bacterium]|nr:DUF3108 domain-containing protein [Candidatus Neomarinimicrobiota bacterium]
MRIYTRKYKIIFLFIISFMLNIAAGQTAHPFSVGERIEYSTWFNFVKGGVSSLEVVSFDSLNSIPVYHIRSVTESNPFFDRFYKVRDKMDSWIDVSGLYSRKFRKSLREGRYRKKYSVRFDYHQMQAISQNDTVSIDSIIHDGISIFYYVRALDLSVGDVIDLNYFDNDKLRPFKIKVENKENIKVPAGEIECYVLTPFSEKGKLFKNKNLVTIYLSTDEKRIPVMISSEALFGSMILKLESIKSPD